MIASKTGLLIASFLCNSYIEIGFLCRVIDTGEVVNHDVYNVEVFAESKQSDLM